MSDSREIQPYRGNVPANKKSVPTASIMTPQGPAIIQVIDMPSGGAMGPYQGPAGGARKPGGIKILHAVLRRWWLVMLVTAIVAGGVYAITMKLMLPKYETEAKLVYQVSSAPNVVGTDPRAVVRAAVDGITDEKIVLLAVHDDELRRALPWVTTYDLSKGDGKRDLVMMLRGTVLADIDEDAGKIYITASRNDPMAAWAVCNAFAKAVKDYITDSLASLKSTEMKDLRQRSNELLSKLQHAQKELIDLKTASDQEAKTQQYQTALKEMNDLQSQAQKADIELRLGEAQLETLEKGLIDKGQLTAAAKIALKKAEAEELSRDSILQAYMAEQVKALNQYQELLAAGMTKEHPEVKRAMARLDRAQADTERRTSEIRTLVAGKVREEVTDVEKANIEALRSKVTLAKNQMDVVGKKRIELNEQMRGLVKSLVAIQAVEQQISMLNDEYKTTSQALNTMRFASSGNSVSVDIDQPAYVPREPTTDKRTKVQIASVAGGFFLGILLALLVDKFDKRLRDPKDIEPLMGVPVLGMIPRIQELKRIKGEQAKNLIAEEFRIIRTQILFGNPNLQHKTICVTSPAPGDGKTSLAVNLAISIAKAGRRTLLVDADLRKPDVHRIFNIPDAPGLAELIHGTCEPGTAIRKSDIEMLDVLPAGIPSIRPSELLSRPEMGRLMAALCELYDHIVFDSAPLLPVSDTHVLAGMVECVVCSFNAEVDRDTVTMVQEILRRSNANVVGTVMNQVKYKHTNTYTRGKSAYDSYYNSPRGAGTALAKPPQGQAKPEGKA